MGMSQVQLILVYSVAVIYAVALTYVSGDDVILQKRSERNRIDMDRFMEDGNRLKRPFCNAFTGCGKKRSDESMANLVDLNSEPAVEELSKQILSEAKLWEALQEARAEVQRGREGPNMIPRDVPLPLAMPGFRRKRSSAKTENSTYNNKVAHNQKR
ncbi:UNVERIFIED_CONTAM: hypothetical protein PYX00_007429 [Menopon gallinae]|uniref:Cardioactive peptide n=1 Tax=Menopon gallinae TaxID=328185 RepID=A0AAW2HJZ7_9NEOP